MSSGVCLLGTFPPPVHGMSMANAAVLKALESRGAAPLVLDISARSLDRRVTQRLSRVPKVLSALVRYARARELGQDHAFYAALSAGMGQLYDALFVGAARLRRARVFVHHHSFAYVERRSHIMALVTRLAGPEATHVVLCDAMDRALREQYAIKNTRVVANAALTASSLAGEPRRAVTTIGFLGNISRAKGVFDVLEVAKALGIKCRIAGPYEDETVQREVEATVAGASNIEIVGAVYGADKARFLRSIDVMLFPSTLTEASPLVIIEALASGVPVIARDRGCIRSTVAEAAGYVVARDEDFVDVVLREVRAWRDQPAEFQRASRAARDAWQVLAASADSAFAELLDDIYQRGR